MLKNLHKGLLGAVKVEILAQTVKQVQEDDGHG